MEKKVFEIIKNLFIFSNNEKKRGQVSQQKKKSRYFKKKLVLIIISIFCIFILSLLLINWRTNLIVRDILSEELEFQLDKVSELEAAQEQMVSMSQDPPYQVSSPINVRTFGDIFSSLTHINREQTDMYWDTRIGSFLFPPRLTIEKKEACNQVACGYLFFEPNWQGYCNQSDCLEVIDNQLYLNDDFLALPTELADKNIRSLTLGGVADQWLIGLVLGADQDEEAWVYRFDGEFFKPLINQDTDWSFKITSNNLNGHLSFGGQIDDFLIFYGGYYGKIVRYYQGQFIDLSDFISLDISRRGNFPLIQKSDQTRSFYICNTILDQPSLVKLWQAKNGEVIGSVDLSRLVFSGESVSRVLCYPGQSGAHLTLIVLINQQWQKWYLTDNGFNNRIIRQIISNNINNSGQVVQAAKISNYNLKSEKTADESYQFFFSNDNQTYTPTRTNNWLVMADSNKELYWRIVFKVDNNDPYYSPWFNSLNIINYEIID